ncbi:MULTISPECIES: phage terminase small subunit P27 family [Companilactobacillus]|uniref:phage terminase small subunit P27 family n=1 Tax=Companilactobacillus TaxID=2767879 RepID=UPI000660C538|nr:MULTISPECIES: phage terminase small subunit P27 family [Companilactobacillus]MQS88275.1 phage terminase small subunit P27 family [Companilactobacillus mishanensis]
MKQPNAGRKRNLAVVDPKHPEQNKNKEALIEANKKLNELDEKPPAHLPKYAKQLWKELAPELNKVGMVTSLDSTNFELFCMQYQEHRDAVNAIKKYGSVYEDSNGNLKKNPAVNVADTATKNLRSLGMILGIDYNSRSQNANTESDNNIDINEAMKAFGG